MTSLHFGTCPLSFMRAGRTPARFYALRPST
jgi:hypothetical protein